MMLIARKTRTIASVNRMSVSEEIVEKLLRSSRRIVEILLPPLPEVLHDCRLSWIVELLAKRQKPKEVAKAGLAEVFTKGLTRLSQATIEIRQAERELNGSSRGTECGRRSPSGKPPEAARVTS